MTQTTIIIKSSPYQLPPTPPNGWVNADDHDDCDLCGLPAYTRCGNCPLHICSDHGKINPVANQPPLCPSCYLIAQTAHDTELILERVEKLLQAIKPVRGLHGQN